MMGGYGAMTVYRQWVPARGRQPRAVFLLVHGLGAHTGRWEGMAEYLRERDIASYALELHRTDGFGKYFAATTQVYDTIARENPSVPVFLAGESLGALVAFFAAARSPGAFRGLVCISPAFANRIRLSPFDYVKMGLALLCAPKKLFRVPFDSSMCTRDDEYRRKMDAHPGEHRTASAALLAQIMLYQWRARFVRRVKTPVLFLVAGADKIIDQKVTGNIFNGLTAKDKTFEEFPGMYHALTIDVGKEAIFEKIVEWTEQRI